MSKHIDSQVGLAYLEGRLDGAQRAKIERHLADCATCQAELEAHQAIHHLLQTSGKAAAKTEVHVPNWHEVKPQAKKETIGVQLWQHGTQLALAGAAMALILFFVLQLRPANSVFEPVAAGKATPTTTPTPMETAVPLPTVPTVNVIPNIFPTTTDTLPTPSPTATPIPSTPSRVETIPGEAVAKVQLNATGQAAFVLDGTLYVETAVSANTFTPIASHLASEQLAWSADGEDLLFFVQPDNAKRPLLMHWDTTSQQTTPLSELIHRPLPDVPFNRVHWAENGRELLLTTVDKLTPNSEWDSGVWLANLDNGKLTLVVEAIRLIDANWLDKDSFMMSLNCGEQCEILMAYDREQNLLWKAYANQPEFEATSGLYVMQPEGDRILHLNTFNKPQTVDAIDTITGAITPLLSLPENLQFAANSVVFSPKAHALLFETVDENGARVLQQLNLEDTSMRPFAIQDNALAFKGGAWSPNGKYFIYNILDAEIEASYVYLWQTENVSTKLIHVAATNRPFQDFVWSNDEKEVYFNLANETLWRYDVFSGELNQIAGQ